MHTPLFIGFEDGLQRYRRGLIAYHPPHSIAPDPHGNVTCLVVERVRAVLSPGPPAPDDDGRVAVDPDVMLVATGLRPVAFA